MSENPAPQPGVHRVVAGENPFPKMFQRDGIVDGGIRADFAVPRRPESPLPFLRFLQEATGRVESGKDPFRVPFDRFQVSDCNLCERQSLQLARLLCGELQEFVRELHMLPAQVVKKVDRSGAIGPEKNQSDPPQARRRELLSSRIGGEPTGRPEPFQFVLGDDLPLQLGRFLDQPGANPFPFATFEQNRHMGAQTFFGRGREH